MKINRPGKRCMKVRFKSKRDAYAARDLAASSGRVYDGVRAYECPWCKAFHLGHPPDRGHRAKTGYSRVGTNNV